jgi:nucleotide-binding universal stress UspA family protein
VKSELLKSVFHPSDFSDASDVAFVHALKIALVTRARLNMLHVTPDRQRQREFDEFPGVRATLARWHLLPAGSPTSAIGKLGIRVSKVIASNDQPVAAALDFLASHPADLIVLAVRQRDGRMRWMDDRVGEPIARASGEMTLFIPQGVAGFVAHADGSVCVRNILVPIDSKPKAQPAVDAAEIMIRGLELHSGTLHLLHAGPAVEMPDVVVPRLPGWRAERIAVDGEPVETILQTAANVGADLIVMSTEGPHGFLDALRGSTSERVLRRSPCPVVSLPAEQWLSRVRQFWRN